MLFFIALINELQNVISQNVNNSITHDIGNILLNRIHIKMKISEPCQNHNFTHVVPHPYIRKI